MGMIRPLQERAGRAATPPADPKISVVLPVYNGARYIAQAIRSVLYQTYPAHELIVVDDGSTDDTPRILERFAGRIRVRRQANGGLSCARNAALAMVTGDAVALIDDDDIWFKRKLEKQAQAVRSYPEAGFFCSNYFTRKDDDGSAKIRHYSSLPNRAQINFDGPLKEDPFKLLLRNNFVGAPSTVLMRQELIDKVGRFNEDYPMAEDLEYFLRCARETCFLVTGEPLVFKRTRSGSLSMDTVQLLAYHRRALLEAAQDHRLYIRQNGYRKQQGTFLAQLTYQLGHVNFEAGKAGRAFALYCEAFRCQVSAANAVRFLLAVFKKAVRILIFDLVNRKKIRLAFCRLRALIRTDPSPKSQSL